MTQQVTVVALLAAAVLGPGTLHEAGVAGALIFGIGNALLALPGTRWVRLVAICGAMVALLWPAKLLVALGILAWLAWPPAFLVAWALGSPPRVETNNQQSDSATRSRIALAAIILAVALASIAFRFFVIHRLEQTAALFIGIPTLLAIVVVVSGVTAVSDRCRGEGCHHRLACLPPVSRRGDALYRDVRAAVPLDGDRLRARRRLG